MLWHKDNFVFPKFLYCIYDAIEQKVCEINNEHLFNAYDHTIFYIWKTCVSIFEK